MGRRTSALTDLVLDDLHADADPPMLGARFYVKNGGYFMRLQDGTIVPFAAPGALILYHVEPAFGGGGGILFLRPEGADLSIEVRTQQVMPRAGTMKNLTVLPGSNTRTMPTVLTVRKNFVDTLLTVTIPAAPFVGVVADVVDTVAFAATDILTVKLDFSVGAGVLGFGFSCAMEFA